MKELFKEFEELSVDEVLLFGLQQGRIELSDYLLAIKLGTDNEKLKFMMGLNLGE